MGAAGSKQVIVGCGLSDEDDVFSADRGRRLADRMADARFELVAGGRHFLQYERPDEVAGAIEAFVEEL